MVKELIIPMILCLIGITTILVLSPSMPWNKSNAHLERERAKLKNKSSAETEMKNVI